MTRTLQAMSLARRAARFTGRRRSLVLAAILLASAAVAVADDALVPALPEIEEELTEVVIQANEPRYVAPTRRDRIGRIWAPVYINEKGPFRLVLDTGSSHAAVNSS